MRCRNNSRMASRTETSASEPRTGIDFGWEAHRAVQAWTASVDTKASVVLAVEAAVTGAAASALIRPKGELHAATGLHLATAISAVAFLVAAVGCALWVVFPRLERARTRRLAPTGLVYFGHLRERGADEIAQALAALTPAEERRQLASQLCVTGAVAWRKHSWLQRSLTLFAVGAGLLVVAFAAF
jgi:hypothetical protein